MNAKRNGAIGGVVALVVIAVVVFLVMRKGDEPVVIERPPAKAVAVAPTATPAAQTPAAVVAPAAEAAPLAEAVAVQAEPAPVVAPVVVAPTATPEAVIPSSGVTIRVVEEGTETPLVGVRVRLSTEDEEAEGSGWRGGPGGFGGFGPPAPPGQAGAPLELDTDATGVARFSDVPVDAYTIVARWGMGPRHVEEKTLSIVAGKSIERTVMYPARQPFKIRLIDEAEQPVANHPVQAVLLMNPWAGGGGPGGGGFGAFFDRFAANAEEAWESKTTDASGTITVLGYEGMRGAGIRSDRDELFSSEMPNREGDVANRDRGRDRGPWGQPGWTNPFFDRRELSTGEDLVIIVRRDVVVATGILVDAPKPRSAAGYAASVRGSSLMLPSIPVLSDRFKFLALPSQRLDVTIRQAIAVGGEGTRPSFEKRTEVKLPDEIGPFEFEIDMGDRVEIEGIVYMPDGGPAEGITVYAQGFNEKGAAAETAESVSRRNGSGGRDRGMGSWAGGDSTEARLVANATDSGGRFRLELPKALDYLFGTDTQTLPADAKGSDPVIASWEQLEGGQRIELHLKPSSLVWGEVVDRAGNPVPNTEVNLRGPDIPFNSPDFRAYTDSEGMFELNIPPIRLSAPDPEEPPSHYVFAWNRVEGGGLGQVFIDDADTPVRIQLSPFATVRLTATRGGQPVNELQMSQLYSVPGFSQPISARNNGRRRSGDGTYDFPFLIKGTSSVNVWLPGADDDVRTIFVDDDSADVQAVAIDFPPPPAPDPTPEGSQQQAGM